MAQRMIVWVVVLAALAAPVPAQWLERTIYPLDSLIGLSYPQALAYRPSSQTVYVAGSRSRSILAVNAGAAEKLVRIPVLGNTTALFYNPVTDELVGTTDWSDTIVTIVDCATNRVKASVREWNNVSAVLDVCADSSGTTYIANPGTGCVTIVRADSVVARVRAGWLLASPCYSATTNCVYVANGSGRSLAIIRDDRVVGAITVAAGPGPIILAPDLDRIFCSTGENKLQVVDILQQRVTAEIPIPVYAGALCYNPVSRKVYYLPGTTNLHSDTLIVIDAEQNAERCRIPVGVAPGALIVNPRTNRVYCMSGRGGVITVIDGAGDSVLGTVECGGSGDRPALALDATGQRLCAVHTGLGRLSVIDATRDSLLAAVPLAGALGDIAVSADGSKLYSVAGYDGCTDTLYVADPATGGIMGTLPAVGPPGALFAHPVHAKLYVANSRSGLVSILDTRTDSILAADSTSGIVTAFCYDSRDDRVYCVSTAGRRVIAICGAGDSIVAEIPTPREPAALGWNSTDNKVYVGCRVSSTRDSLAVIDCRTNTRRPGRRVQDTPTAIAHSMTDDRVYCAMHDANRILVLDGANDSIKDTISGLRGPQALCLDQRRSRLYCANYHRASVSVIDCSTNEVIATIPAGSKPVALCCDPDQSVVWCVNELSNSVTMASTLTNEVIANIAVGASPGIIIHDPVHNRILVANHDDASVSVIRDSMSGVADQPSARPEDLVLAIRPTVTSGLLHVRFSRPLDRALTIGVFDPAGRQAQTFTLSPTSTRGLPAVDLDLRTLASGVYFVRSVPAGRLSAQKIIVRR